MPISDEDFGVAIQSYVSEYGGDAESWSVAMDPNSGTAYIERWELPFSEPTEAELEASLLAAKQKQKIREFHGLAFADLAPLFTEGFGPDETLYVLVKHIEVLFNTLGLTISDPRLLKIIEVGDKAMAKEAQINAIQATDPDPLGELENITWEP